MKEGTYFSKKLNQKLYIYQMERKGDNPYDTCSCCGKPLKRKVYAVTGEDGLESLYGSGCIKELQLRYMIE